MANVPSLTGSDGKPKTLPSKSARRKTPTVLVVAGLLTLAGLAVGGGYLLTAGNQAVRADLILHTVKYQPLSLTVVERGTLESAENKDVICKVKSRSASVPASTIKWVIDDGTQVVKDQVVMELDNSALEDQLRSQKVLVDQARALMVKAEEDYKIVVSQNLSDIATAEVTLKIAELDLKKYQEGDYEQQLKDVKGRIDLAISDLRQWEDRVRWSERMVGRGYLSGAQAEADRARRDSARFTLAKAEEELRILKTYTKIREETDLRSKIEEARRALDRVKQQAIAKEVQAATESITKKSIYYQELDKYNDIEQQISLCTIVAPQDGMVVYYIPEQTRFGTSNGPIIAQGEPVREGQKLMRIPDLRRMMVMTRVHESMVSRIRGDSWRQTGFTDQVRAALLVGRDPMTNLIGQHVFFDSTRDHLRDKYRKHVQILESEGHSATIRVDAFPDHLFKGRIKSVATVASQQDWMSTDVKVYQTAVMILNDQAKSKTDSSSQSAAEDDLSSKGITLKPGMSAEVTITIEDLTEEVLTIPVQAVVGGTELGESRKCFVMTDAGPVERAIKLGLSNERVVEIREGLREGEQVVVNPRALVGDKLKTRDQRGGEGKGESKGGRGKGAGGFGKQGNGGSPPSLGGGPGSPGGSGGPSGPGSAGGVGGSGQVGGGPPPGVGPGRKQ